MFCVVRPSKEHHPPLKKRLCICGISSSSKFQRVCASFQDVTCSQAYHFSTSHLFFYPIYSLCEFSQEVRRSEKVGEINNEDNGSVEHVCDYSMCGRRDEIASKKSTWWPLI